MQIIIDDREPPEIGKILRTQHGCIALTRRLELGDYLVDGKFLFERKTMMDFATSVIDGRLLNQANRMAKSKLKCVLILEGASKDIVHSQMSRNALQGALIAVSVGYGIPLLRAMSPAESAKLILYTANQANAYANGAIARQGQRPKNKNKLQLHILQGLPNIGAQRAQVLLKRYGSVEKILLASEQDLAETPSIGLITAQKIRWAVSEMATPYVISR